MKHLGVRALLAPEAFVIVAFVAAFAFLPTQSPYFLTPGNLSQIVTDTLEIAIIALALTPLLIIREIDLSVGSVLGLSSVIFGTLTQAGVPWPLAAIAAVACGGLAGLLNGLIVTRFNLSSIIVTLATLALFRGLANVIVSDHTIVGLPASFQSWDMLTVFGTVVTVPQLLFAIVAVLAGIALHRSVAGRQIYFIGASPEVARATAVRVDRIRIALFVLSGVGAALAGLLLASRFASVRADTGSGFELLALTVVLLGGVSILGGVGSIIGVVIAAVLFGSVRSGMALAGYPDQARVAVVGLMLLLSIASNVLMRRMHDAWRRRRSLNQLQARSETAGAPSTAEGSVS